MLIIFLLIQASILLSAIINCQQCPERESIEPFCTCTISGGGRDVNLDCSKVEHEDQLETMFETTDFPQSDLASFTISGNKALKTLSRNVFGNVSFQMVSLINDAVNYIDESVFENSQLTLQKWNVHGTPLSGRGFPFASLENYSTLTHLTIREAGLTKMPSIKSHSLKLLNVNNNGIADIPLQSVSALLSLTELHLNMNRITKLIPGVFDSAKSLVYIGLHENYLREILAKTFSNLINLSGLDLSDNELSYIEEGALSNLPKLDVLNLDKNFLFDLKSEIVAELPTLRRFSATKNKIANVDDGIFTYNSKLSEIRMSSNLLTRVESNDFTNSSATYFDLEENLIEFIAEGSFRDLRKGTLILNDNKITTLDEEWLRPILEAENSVYLDGNHLDCGCDLGWLLRTPDLQQNLYSAFCNNGTSITDLNASYFEENC